MASAPPLFLVILSPLPYSIHSPTLPQDHCKPSSLSPQSPSPLLSSLSRCSCFLFPQNRSKWKETVHILLPPHPLANLLRCLYALPSLLLLWKNYLCSYLRATPYLWIRFHSFWPQGHSSGSFLPLYWTIPSVYKQMLKSLPPWEENKSNP